MNRRPLYLIGVMLVAGMATWNVFRQFRAGPTFDEIDITMAYACGASEQLRKFLLSQGEDPKPLHEACGKMRFVAAKHGFAPR